MRKRRYGKSKELTPNNRCEWRSQDSNPGAVTPDSGAQVPAKQHSPLARNSLCTEPGERTRRFFALLWAPLSGHTEVPQRGIPGSLFCPSPLSSPPNQPSRMQAPHQDPQIPLQWSLVSWFPPGAAFTQQTSFFVNIDLLSAKNAPAPIWDLLRSAKELCPLHRRVN